jgi:hypothetical protein
LKLTIQQRAATDPDHTRRIEQLVDKNIRNPITQAHLDYIRHSQLSSADVSELNSPWNLKATCLSASNVECSIISKYRGSLFALLKEGIFTA